MAVRIDGKALAAQVKEQVRREVETLSRQPGLAVILVGERKDSQTYVRNKERMCMKDGIKPFDYKFPADISEVCCGQWIGSFSG